MLKISSAKAHIHTQRGKKDNIMKTSILQIGIYRETFANIHTHIRFIHPKFPITSYNSKETKKLNVKKDTRSEKRISQKKT